MLIEIWDYLMRRKKLLLLLSASIALGGYGIAQLLPAPTNAETSYIHLDSWGTPQEVVPPSAVEIPRTGETNPTSALAVLTPREVASLAPAPIIEVDDFSTVVDGKTENSTQNLTTSPNPKNSTLSTIFGEIILSLLGAGVVALGAYLTYQHFMR